MMQRIKKTNAVNVVFMWKLLDFSLDMPPTIEWREKICEVMSLSKETADILVTCVQGILESTIVLTKALYGGTPSKLHLRQQKKRHEVLTRKYYELVDKGYLQDLVLIFILFL
ncbi:hypothetical protein AtEden1_Chr5g0112631 [Arabidopsis thaliana]